MKKIDTTIISNIIDDYKKKGARSCLSIYDETIKHLNMFIDELQNKEEQNSWYQYRFFQEFFEDLYEYSSEEWCDNLDLFEKTIASNICDEIRSLRNKVSELDLQDDDGILDDFNILIEEIEENKSYMDYYFQLNQIEKILWKFSAFILEDNGVIDDLNLIKDKIEREIDGGYMLRLPRTLPTIQNELYSLTLQVDRQMGNLLEERGPNWSDGYKCKTISNDQLIDGDSVMSDFEFGMYYGRVMALRWILGEESEDLIEEMNR